MIGNLGQMLFKNLILPNGEDGQRFMGFCGRGPPFCRREQNLSWCELRRGMGDRTTDFKGGGDFRNGLIPYRWGNEGLSGEVVCPKSHSKSGLNPSDSAHVLTPAGTTTPLWRQTISNCWGELQRRPRSSLWPGRHSIRSPWLGSLLGGFCSSSTLDRSYPPLPSAASPHRFLAHAAWYHTEI